MTTTVRTTELQLSFLILHRLHKEDKKKKKKIIKVMFLQLIIIKKNSRKVISNRLVATSIGDVLQGFSRIMSLC